MRRIKSDLLALVCSLVRSFASLKTKRDEYTNVRKKKERRSERKRKEPNHILQELEKTFKGNTHTLYYRLCRSNTLCSSESFCVLTLIYMHGTSSVSFFSVVFKHISLYFGCVFTRFVCVVFFLALCPSRSISVKSLKIIECASVYCQSLEYTMYTLYIHQLKRRTRKK